MDSIENAYQALSKEEKADVHNYQVYEAARERLKDATIEHLQAEAKSKALTLVREKIKQSLKSPQSYNEYSCEAEPPIILEDSAECSMIIKIKYGATNSFGAEVTKSVSALVSFSVDMENKSVSITDSFIM